MSVEALVVAPGAGFRLGGTALALLPLLGRPLVGHAVAAARDAGAQRVTLVVEPGSLEDDAYARARDALGVSLHAAGTGGAAARVSPELLRAALAATQAQTVITLEGTAALVRAGTLRQLLEIHAREGAAATRLVDPEGGTSAPACVCILERRAAVRALAAMDSHDGDVHALFAALVDAGGVVASAAAGDPEELRVVTSAAGAAEALGALRERRNRELMEAGVVIEDPPSTWVEADAVVEPGARLRPGCHLEGRTRVAAGAEVGPFARLVDVSLGPGARVLDHCLLLGSVVEEGALIGPFAHIRPQSRVRRRAKVGNFVELKKTDLGEGSKAPHLSYLGDATIGAQVNVGAGTITCNYDGTHKHPTHIAEHAFIGSDAVLVAPVSVGAGAYVAAGSTITADVPAGGLAFGRARQVVKAGGAARLLGARRGGPSRG